MKFINDNFLNTPDELEISSSSLIPYTHGWTEKKMKRKGEKRELGREREREKARRNPKIV
jgi:hypothetical protein